MSAGGGGGSREVAYRLFAAEYDDADLSYSESDEERAPNYVVSPTGARINRLFVVGVLTEVEAVNEEMVRARVVDPTGAFVVYAGQYQPEALAFLERAEPPTFVAVTGKARTFQPEDGDRIYTSVRPESVSAVDASTRDRWTVQAAERTIERVGVMAGALASDRRGEDLAAALREEGVAEGLAAGVPLAIDHYRTTPAYLDAVRDLALDALRVVAGERDEVEGLAVAPDAPGEVAAAELAAVDVPAAAAQPSDGGDPSVEEPSSEGGRTEGATDRESPASGEGVPTPDADEGDAVQEAAADRPEPTETAEHAESATAEADDGDSLGDFESAEFEMDEAERREVEATYGTEFETGAEVDEPGAADVEPGADSPPAADPDPAAEVGESGETGPSTAGGAEPSEPGAPEPDDGGAEPDEPGDAEPAESDDGRPDERESAEPSAGDGDLEEAAVAAMRELDDGDGADREAVVSTVVDARDVDPEAVEEAIQDALMGGQCYEPDEGRLKAI